MILLNIKYFQRLSLAYDVCLFEKGKGLSIPKYLIYMQYRLVINRSATFLLTADVLQKSLID